MTRLAILASTLFLASFLIGDLNGKWVGKIKIPSGEEIEVTYNFKADTSQLSGSVLTPWGEFPITNGKVNKDQYSFTQELNNTTYTHTGRVSGDSLYIKIAGAETPIEGVFLKSPAK